MSSNAFTAASKNTHIDNISTLHPPHLDIEAGVHVSAKPDTAVPEPASSISTTDRHVEPSSSSSSRRSSKEQIRPQSKSAVPVLNIDPDSSLREQASSATLGVRPTTSVREQTSSTPLNAQSSHAQLNEKAESGDPSNNYDNNEKANLPPFDRHSTEPDPSFRTKWAINDPENPLNWSNARKWWLTFMVSMLSMAASLGTAIISPAADTIAAEFSVSAEVVVLNVSLYILGFALGPIFWAPVSEVWGRRLSLLPPMFALALFSIGAGVSQTVAALFACRFFSGFFGSAPVSNVYGVLGDIWTPQARGTAAAIYTVAVVGGPTLGPVVGGALTVNPSLGWRWTGYVFAIWAFAVTLLSAAFFPETYSPLLLKRRSARLRASTRDTRWHHPHEAVKLDPRSIVRRQLVRPVQMLLTEPIIASLSLYAAFVYALQFVALEVFPIVYQIDRGWPLLTSTLPFLALLVGELAAMAVALANQPRIMRAIEANGGKPVPEARMPPMIGGGVLFVAGLFWFGWTVAEPSVPWESNVVAAVLIGAGFDIIFQQCINVLVDIYQQYSASAVGATTLLRSLLAAGLPLAARPMFLNLGVGPAMSILGGVAVLAIPIPFVLMRYGVRMRRASKFATVDEDE